MTTRQVSSFTLDEEGDTGKVYLEDAKGEIAVAYKIHGEAVPATDFAEYARWLLGKYQARVIVIRELIVQLEYLIRTLPDKEQS